MNELDIISLVKQLGPFVGLLGFFIWRDKQREERLGTRLDAMQDRYATTMETIVRDNSKAMQQMAEAAAGMGKALSDHTVSDTRLADVLHDRPCILRGLDKETI
jgi:hypothetical protein